MTTWAATPAAKNRRLTPVRYFNQIEQEAQAKRKESYVIINTHRGAEWEDSKTLAAGGGIENGIED